MRNFDILLLRILQINVRILHINVRILHINVRILQINVRILQINVFFLILIIEMISKSNPSWNIKEWGWARHEFFFFWKLRKEYCTPTYHVYNLVHPYLNFSCNSNHCTVHLSCRAPKFCNVLLMHKFLFARNRTGSFQQETKTDDSLFRTFRV